MLKQLYKTLLISVISWSLLTFQSAVVFAASESKATVTTDSNGVITSKKSVHFEKVSDNDMLASITMLAGGFIAGRMYQNYSPVSIDVTIAAAGGVAFIAGEIMSNVKFKGTIDGMTAEVEKKSDGTFNEEQIQRLQDLRQSYSEAKNTTKTKKTLQLASAAAFGAAALTAAYMATTEEGAVMACQTALNGAKAGLASCASGSLLTAPSEAKACVACQGEMAKYHTTLVTYSKTRSIPSPSRLKDAQTIKFEQILEVDAGKVQCLQGGIAAKISTGVASVCTPTIKLLIADQQSAKKITLTQNSKDIHNYLGLPVQTLPIEPVKTNIFANYLERSLSLFFPEAKASWLPLLGLGAGTALAFTGILGTMGVSVDTYMYVPRNRAVAFGALAGVAYMASRSSDNVIQKLDEHIKKIDAILADMSKLAKGAKAQNLQNQAISIQTINPGSVEINTYTADGVAKSPCMAGNSSENCTTLSDKLSSMPGFANLPDSLKGIASQAVNLGDSLSGSTGISGSTITTAESLGSKQNAISKALQNQQAALVKISNGSFDPKKEDEKFKNTVNAGLKKELQKHGMTATGFMASIGATPIDSSVAKDDKGNDKLKKESATSNAINMASDGEATKEKEEAFKLDFKEEPQMAEGIVLGAPQVSGNDRYDVKTNEIGGENGPSIFELISRRYIKSGYPKLLEEEPAKN